MTAAPIYCDWKPSETQARGVECRLCGRYSYEPIKCRCRLDSNAQFKPSNRAEAKAAGALDAQNGEADRASPIEEPVLLGDKVEAWLTSFGITKSRYREIKQKFGLPSNCDCDARQRWLNEVGQYLGIGVDDGD